MIKAKDINEHSGWRKLTPGCEIYEGGTSKLTITGEWRTMRPIIDETKCMHCLLCSPYCPDSAIPVSGDKRLPFDLDHCKGCGICASVCPYHAIEMVEEGK